MEEPRRVWYPSTLSLGVRVITCQDKKKSIYTFLPVVKQLQWSLHPLFSWDTTSFGFYFIAFGRMLTLWPRKRS